MKHDKVVAIHQPTFFPWLGYFNKLTRADQFIVLDNVQLPRKGAGTWSNRVQLMINRQPAWVTVPIVRAARGVQEIKDVEIHDDKSWRVKLLKTIQMNYPKAPFFEVVFPFLGKLIDNRTSLLTDYNLFAIISLAKAFRIDDSKIILGSSLNVQGSATDLLVSMVKAVNGTAYLCGGGAGGYQEDQKFSEAGLELIYQNYKHPVYPQRNAPEFIPGLSVIDVLMNCGFEKTGELVRNG